MIFGDWIGRWGHAFPDREALVDAIQDRRYSYGMMAADIYRMANYLRQHLNVQAGDRVACLSLNRTEYIILFFALSRLGAILVPLNFRLAAAEFTYYLEDAAPRALFFDHEHQARVNEFKHNVKLDTIVCFDDDESVGQSLPRAWQRLSSEPPPEIEIGADDPQLIIYTSGTTGLPKGVILTHGMITWNSINTVLGWDMHSDDKTVLHAAMFYTAGWNVFTLPLFYCRGANILIQRFEPDLILDLIEREGVTIFFGVPTMFQMMLASPRFAATDFSSVRFMVSGGAPLGKDILESFETRKSIRIWEGYGLHAVGPNNLLADGKPGTLC
jgi:fatty-acyl-CoA synthase